jgi:hypothetical protein
VDGVASTTGEMPATMAAATEMSATVMTTAVAATVMAATMTTTAVATAAMTATFCSGIASGRQHGRKNNDGNPDIEFWHIAF